MEFLKDPETMEAAISLIVAVMSLATGGLTYVAHIYFPHLFVGMRQAAKLIESNDSNDDDQKKIADDMKLKIAKRLLDKLIK
jgi:hypothetical protein